jgi:hypothetical protein
MECEELQLCGAESMFVEFEVAECGGKMHGLCPKAIQVERHALADQVKMTGLREHPEDRDFQGGPEIPRHTGRTRLDRQGLSCCGQRRRKVRKETIWRGVIGQPEGDKSPR